ncbi:PTS fructose transporter subunit IIABC [Texcoconibacillus texcoconensis]|uniref:PTS system fructose-specific IIC component n=1 Tax=Texcoconibacillus texcoconensis TaxID=1095777 RepID=A0A840QSE1_9BACI|nr:PTS fructose transporter subunit IIABC [Texcoconibacillus texcoconensis]MBB5174233.1 PTS system fructose-specific IIC component [Texcoconibacillus texcoconensis]
MKITELLLKETIILDLQSETKETVIDEMVTCLSEKKRIDDHNAFKGSILERESQSSTGVGEGVAIPHAKSSAVKEATIALGRTKKGVDFDSLDNQPVHLIFMIAAPEGANDAHLQALSRLSTLLMDASFRKEVLEATTEDEILKAVDKKEKEKLDSEERVHHTSAEAKSGQAERKVLAITGCPTGIAHTYMAADALKEKGQEMRVNLKVQTNGSDGVKNRLTEQDIAEAEGIIVAADTKVDLSAFKGKTVLQRGVTDGMKRPGELIQQVINGDAPIYQGENDQEEAQEGQSSSGGAGFYKHLMNGVSNMLPFVVGGGILVALSFMFGIESEHPLAEALGSIGGGHALALMVAVLAGFIAMSIADRPGFAPGMIGGYMSTTGPDEMQAGFLGGIIAGFLAGYVVLWLKRVFKNLPQSLDGIKTVLLYPLFSILIVGLSMHFIIIEPIGTIMMALENWLGGMTGANAAILGLILGGMMAVDMGGPVNKTAFAFGLAMIEAGTFGPHAAIMAGGMVPPLGLAIATTVFKRKFTKEEADAGKTNYVLGASFITEGAIPFAAADPGRVIPSIIVGSSIAGALSMLFNIGLMAPHGGLFVSPFVEGSWLLYMIAILTGAVVTALMVGFWKKPIK